MTYTELMRLPTFMDRLKALMLKGRVGVDSESQDRIFGQDFYHNSKEWNDVRHYIITRDNGRDLACADRPIFGQILVHHIRPITLQDLEQHSGYLFDPENLITVSLDTHNAIHYSSVQRAQLRSADLIERRPNDTIPWR